MAIVRLEESGDLALSLFHILPTTAIALPTTSIAFPTPAIACPTTAIALVRWERWQRQEFLHGSAHFYLSNVIRKLENTLHHLDSLAPVRLRGCKIGDNDEKLLSIGMFLTIPERNVVESGTKCAHIEFWCCRWWGWRCCWHRLGWLGC